MWPFLGLYGLWLWFADRSARTRLLVGVLLLLVGVLWFAPDALVAGEPLRSSEETRGGATAVSVTDVLRRTFDLVALPVHLVALVAVGIAARRRAWAPLSLSAGAAAYVVVELGLTVVGGYDPHVRQAALTAIANLGPAEAAIPLLLGALHDPDADARWSAVDHLGELEQFTDRDVFERTLDDPDESVRKRARGILDRRFP